MNTTRTVSVVMAAYNAAPWIGETLDSVLGQTYPLLEAIVVDDGSTDDTERIVRSRGGIVRYVRENHRGRPNRNLGISHANGEFVAFVDADDVWHPQKIERQMRRIDATQAAWVICDSEAVDAATGQPAPFVPAPVEEGDILQRLFLGNFIVASTPLVAKRVFEDVGYFDEAVGLLAGEDWDLWLRIAARFPVVCVREKLVTLRLHADSLLASTPMDVKLHNLEDVVRSAAQREPRLRSLRRRAVANIYYAAGVQAVRGRRLGEARRYFAEAWLRRPWHVETAGYILLSLLGTPAMDAAIGLKKPSRRRATPPAS